MKALIFNIQRYSLHNYSEIRTIAFFKNYWHDISLCANKIKNYNKWQINMLYYLHTAFYGVQKIFTNFAL
ncbi:hypothetical protein LL037_01265 [Clostridium estertheticum]|uniref:Uncharacterized protein n=1 Tax=Clostridium estertheticum TaxID=238834 RepID=A0AA47I5W7_9CLOT|nr:hypothetical protein [Clostridium estertheticum]MBU3155580.1 hypothetical protein [Clostridium estertheticum]MBU3198103.1 hypothetical protein [Clostridium estertheticum]WAG60023.1 hypothetical protein LL038_21185 [Clostridium estertheticum]WAG65897.1 hypothetical protein LL037_01265 [Clostridium estertheticum]